MVEIFQYKRQINKRQRLTKHITLLQIASSSGYFPLLFAPKWELDERKAVVNVDLSGV